ncbi:MAG: hypothetical protein ISS45_09415 [Candidatus Omnitrophica bacterium]|nr:hypothetical protein [Candidatus Omnitrophota bacterium]
MIDYKEAIKRSMEMLAEDENRVFLGYNICYGSKAYGTLTDIPDEQKIETPVAENLITGIAIGMALEGYKPVVFFERHDFMLIALDSIVNHLDKINLMSDGQFKTPVIIRATVGSKKPLYPGPQHIQDFSVSFKKMVSFPVYMLNSPQDVMKYYQKAKDSSDSVMLIERKELYNKVM